MSFKEELDYLNSTEEKEKNLNQRVQLTQVQTDQIKNTNSNIPVDFLDYLLEIGCGSIMHSQFKVYNDLTDFIDLGLNDLYSLPAGVKLFGDNFSGDFSGFDLSKEKTDEVVEFWHDSKEVYYTGKTFREYIREKMLMPHS
ncbi:MAG: SMI1/KNR4 family protein [Fluviicola sp.]